MQIAERRGTVTATVPGAAGAPFAAHCVGLSPSLSPQPPAERRALCLRMCAPLRLDCRRGPGSRGRWFQCTDPLCKVQASAHNPRELSGLEGPWGAPFNCEKRPKRCCEIRWTPESEMGVERRFGPRRHTTAVPRAHHIHVSTVTHRIGGRGDNAALGHASPPPPQNNLVLNSQTSGVHPELPTGTLTQPSWQTPSQTFRPQIYGPVLPEAAWAVSAHGTPPAPTTTSDLCVRPALKTPDIARPGGRGNRAGGFWRGQ